MMASKTPHVHSMLTYEEAQRLEKIYREQGRTVTRVLNIDQRYFDLHVNLPEQKYLPPTPRSMRSRIWS